MLGHRWPISLYRDRFAIRNGPSGRGLFRRPSLAYGDERDHIARRNRTRAHTGHAQHPPAPCVARAEGCAADTSGADRRRLIALTGPWPTRLMAIPSVSGVADVTRLTPSSLAAASIPSSAGSATTPWGVLPDAGLTPQFSLESHDARHPSNREGNHGDCPRTGSAWPPDIRAGKPRAGCPETEHPAASGIAYALSPDTMP